MLRRFNILKTLVICCCIAIWACSSAPPAPERRPAASTESASGATGSEAVVLVVNTNSAESVEIGDYYAATRAIPADNICRIDTTADEEIHRQIYEKQIAEPVMDCLKQRGLIDQTLYLVTTLGVPLKIMGSTGPGADAAAVDSELCVLYRRLRNTETDTNGPTANPFYLGRNREFKHPEFDVYLVTRLAAYSVGTVKAMIDRSVKARNEGVVVLDLKSDSDEAGNAWLRTAAILIDEERLVIDETREVVRGRAGVIGYGSWGSNDPAVRRRSPDFEWLPGAIASEFVSTNGRTFMRPPADWTLGSWKDKKSFFGGSPQSLTADLLEEGATGASGHVYEPYLEATPRPEYLFPAYLEGRNLAESFYLAIPYVSWMNIVVGDPLCRLE
jgi:uncharacterized protein (TIGR03790 family)